MCLNVLSEEGVRAFVGSCSAAVGNWLFMSLIVHILFVASDM